jgi:hypothetical protein
MFIGWLSEECFFLLWKKVEGKLERRDVIQEFSNYGSQTYAPLTRIGMFLDRGSEQFVVKSKHLNTYQGK